MKKLFILIFLMVSTQSVFAQKTSVLEFSEFLAYVKRYHPTVKQANLIFSESEAKLLKARGAFDPKFSVDYDKKEFKDKNYYNKLNTSFKIPTWYGVELKGNYERNSGTYLNPENTVPGDGLFSLGLSVSLARDFLINQRMASLKQAKLYQKQALADQQVLVNDIIFAASSAYFEWLKRYREKELYSSFLENAEQRFLGIKRSYELGDKPSIDTTEARIAYNNRRLNLEKAKLNYAKASLSLSNFLWIEEVPVELQENIIPEISVKNQIDELLNLSKISELQSDISLHPKLKSLNLKIEGLKVEKRLKANKLMPKIKVQYNLLSETPEQVNTLHLSDYKAKVSLSLPLFFRKERADLRLAKYKLQAVDFKLQNTRLSLKNKFEAVLQEISAYQNQIRITKSIVSDYSTLLKGEERKFQEGESSLFLINSRESKLIQNKLKAIDLENSFLNSKGKLFNVSGFIFQDRDSYFSKEINPNP